MNESGDDFLGARVIKIQQFLGVTKEQGISPVKQVEEKGGRSEMKMRNKNEVRTTARDSRQDGETNRNDDRFGAGKLASEGRGDEGDGEGGRMDVLE